MENVPRKPPAPFPMSLCNPDVPEAFVNNVTCSGAAISAAIQTNSTGSFVNLHVSTQTADYKGFTILKSYDPPQCTSLCTQICANPGSVTNIKCVAWGSPVTRDSATIAGQTRASFQVVVADSDGYNKI
ncbi:hypothetical protein JHW43_001941 [Diplocarpon mali]|nr:hypothetical protein JHW43_001941 [Diplocarpon mali]